MTLFPSLPATPHLSDVFKAFPDEVRPLLEYHDLLLRGEGPLSVLEREIIATYVSGLNACRFCFGAHKIYAKVFGVSEDVIDALLVDVETAPVDDKLKPLLIYAGKLNQLPTKLTPEDAKAVYDAGWCERALYDTIQICGLFNLMNRIIEGTGVTFDYEQTPPRPEDLENRKTRSYVDFGRDIGLYE